MLLSAGSGVQTLTHLSDGQKLQFVHALEPLEDMFDVVLIDSGAGIGENVLFFVGAAQEAILVVSPEPTSLVDAYAAVKVLSQQAGVRTFNVIVNPVVDELAARGIFQKLTAVTSKFLEAKVRHLGYVPRDENLHRAIMAQRPVCEMFPSSPSARAIASIADRLVWRPPDFAGRDGRGAGRRRFEVHVAAAVSGVSGRGELKACIEPWRHIPRVEATRTI